MHIVWGDHLLFYWQSMFYSTSIALWWFLVSTFESILLYTDDAVILIFWFYWQILQCTFSCGQSEAPDIHGLLLFVLFYQTVNGRIKKDPLDSWYHILYLTNQLRLILTFWCDTIHLVFNKHTDLILICGSLCLQAFLVFKLTGILRSHSLSTK